MYSSINVATKKTSLFSHCTELMTYFNIIYVLESLSDTYRLFKTAVQHVKKQFLEKNPTRKDV